MSCVMYPLFEDITLKISCDHDRPCESWEQKYGQRSKDDKDRHHIAHASTDMISVKWPHVMPGVHRVKIFDAEAGDKSLKAGARLRKFVMKNIAMRRIFRQHP